MFKINKKKTIATIIIILLGILLYTYIRGCSTNIGLVYRYEPVARGEVKKTISVTGNLKVLNSHIVLSKINGIIKKVYVDFNQKVKKNQLLALLDSSEFDQNITKVEARKERAALDLLAARNDVEGKKDLLKDNLISKKEMQLAQLKLSKIKTELKRIEIDLNIVLKKRSYARIQSPSSGIIISREIDPSVPVSMNQVLFTIAEDLKKMKLVIHVDESDIGHIKKGQSVTFTVSAFPDKVFTGKITQVRLNPSTNQHIVSYQSIVLCDNKELLLKPGMTATSTVVIFRKKNVIKVPNEAFIVSPVETINEPGKKYVWKKEMLSIGSLPVKKVEVKTGAVGDYYTEILPKTKTIKTGDDVLIGIHKKLDSKEDMYGH